jgi:hypothetical protein
VERFARPDIVRKLGTHGVGLCESGARQRCIALVALHPLGMVEDSLAMASDEDTPFDAHGVCFSHNFSGTQAARGLAGA